MKKLIHLVVMTAILGTIGFAFAGEYRYVKQEVFKEWLQSKKPLVIVDIQAPEAYGKRHFPGSTQTNAFPAKSDAEKKRLDGVLENIGRTKDDIVIVCPRGGGGAKNTWDYLLSRGVDTRRMYILEKGMEGWPHPEMCVTGDK